MLYICPLTRAITSRMLVQGHMYEAVGATGRLDCTSSLPSSFVPALSTKPHRSSRLTYTAPSHFNSHAVLRPLPRMFLHLQAMTRRAFQLVWRAPTRLWTLNAPTQPSRLYLPPLDVMSIVTPFYGSFDRT